MQTDQTHHHYFLKEILALVFVALLVFVSPSAQHGFAWSALGKTLHIDATSRYAWSENTGWVDFGNISIVNAVFSGYAYGENIGWIDMSGITVAANGTLSGYAWSENTGWIDFSGVTLGQNGSFTGGAYGENIGWITFSNSTNNQVALANIPPEFGAEGVSTNQIATSTALNYPKVAISYSIMDVDTAMSPHPTQLDVSFEYNLGSGWQTISSQYLNTGDAGLKTTDSASTTPYTAYWDVKGQLPNIYSPSVQVRVTINDGRGTGNITQATSNTFAVDTKAPVISTLTLDAAHDVLSLAVSDNNNFSYTLTNGSVNDINGVPQNVTLSTSTSITWKTDSATPTAIVVVADKFGNTATSTVTAPSVPLNFDLKDVSNVGTHQWRLFIAWSAYPAVPVNPFDHYEVTRLVDDGSDWTVVDTIGDPNTNFFYNSSLSASSTYSYKVRVVDNVGNSSAYTGVLSHKPNGQGGTDFTPPTISAVKIVSHSTWATVSWTTDELSTSKVEYSLNAFGSYWTASSTSYTVSHVVTLTGLTPGRDYVARVSSSDLFGNKADDDNLTAGYPFSTSAGPIISSVATESVSDTGATIVWNTNVPASGIVSYSTSLPDLIAGVRTSLAGSNAVESTVVGGLVQHRVVVTGLSPHTTYCFFISSTDADSNKTDDNNGNNYYSLSTSYDNKPPVISNIGTPVLTSASAVIIWQTDELADGQVQYRLASSTDAYATMPVDPVNSITHLYTLNGLATSTSYQFLIFSKDLAGNVGTSTPTIFTTTDETIVLSVSNGNSNGAGNGENSALLSTTPPVISDILATSTGTFSTTVTFTTNKPALGTVSYGDSSSPYDFAATAVSGEYTTSHSVSLPGLKPGSTYHYMVRAIDSSGNSSASPDATLTTHFITEALSDLVKLNNASAFQDQLENLIDSVLPSLSRPFITDIAVASTTETGALIRWRTNVPTYGAVNYDLSKATASTGTYSLQTGQTDIKTVAHDLVLQGLTPGTSYHFQIKAFSLPGVVSTSTDKTFATKSLEIPLEVSKVAFKDFEVRWSSPRPTSSVIEYTNLTTGLKNRVEDPESISTHSVDVQNLDSNTSYNVRAFGYDADNNVVEAKNLVVRTKLDNVPPILSPLRIDNALIPGRTDRLQSVVSWKTDKVASSKVYYEEGPGNGTVLKNQVEDKTVTTDHIVIISSLKPATVYRIKIESTDEAGNVGSSAIKTILTPHSAENVLDVIIGNLQQSFGFLKKLQ